MTCRYAQHAGNLPGHVLHKGASERQQAPKESVGTKIRNVRIRYFFFATTPVTLALKGKELVALAITKVYCHIHRYKPNHENHWHR